MKWSCLSQSGRKGKKEQANLEHTKNKFIDSQTALKFNLILVRTGFLHTVYKRDMASFLGLILLYVRVYGGACTWCSVSRVCKGQSTGLQGSAQPAHCEPTPNSG